MTVKAGQFLQCKMFSWRIQVQIVECQGIAHHPKVSYSFLIRLGDQFSPSSACVASPASPQRTVIFNSVLSLSFRTGSPELPSNELQIILVMSPSGGQIEGKSSEEEIIGMTSVTVQYPLQDYLQKPNIFRFDKSLDSQGSVKAQITLNMEQRSLSPELIQKRSFKARKSLELIKGISQDSQYSSEDEKPWTPRSSVNNQGGDQVTRFQEQIEALTSERNELYKISDELYTQLRRCTQERDEYMQELREKVLREEQTKAELQFLKLKVFEYEENQSHRPANEGKVQEQLRQLRKENQQVKTQLAERDKTIRELQRRVKESLIALTEFRQEAVQARSQLIHKESELSVIQTKTLDPQECIQQLVKELEERRYEQPFDFAEYYAEGSRVEQFFQFVKKELSVLFLKAAPRMRAQRDKEWLMLEKGRLERSLEDRLLSLQAGP